MEAGKDRMEEYMRLFWVQSITVWDRAIHWKIEITH